MGHDDPAIVAPGTIVQRNNLLPRLRVRNKTGMGLAAVIFPGQGSQVVGMGKDVAHSSSAARSVFQRANEIAGFDLATPSFEAPAENLGRTDIQ